MLKLIIIKPNLSKVWELEGSKHLLANLAWPVLLLKDLHQIEDLRMLWIEEKVLAWLGVHQGMEESGKAEDQLMLYARWYIHTKLPNWVSNNLKWICRMLCHHQYPIHRRFIETWLFPHQTNKPLSTENLWILLSNFLNYFLDKEKYVWVNGPYPASRNLHIAMLNKGFKKITSFWCSLFCWSQECPIASYFRNLRWLSQMFNKPLFYVQ